MIQVGKKTSRKIKKHTMFLSKIQTKDNPKVPQKTEILKYSSIYLTQLCFQACLLAYKRERRPIIKTEKCMNQNYVKLQTNRI